MEQTSAACQLSQKPSLCTTGNFPIQSLPPAGGQSVAFSCFRRQPARSIPKRQALETRHQSRASAVRIAKVSIHPKGGKSFSGGNTAGRTTPIAAELGFQSAQSDSGPTAKDESSTAVGEEEEGISDADVQASMAAAAGLLGAQETAKPWSIKDEVEGMTDEPVYVPKTPKAEPKTPKEVIFDLLFLLGGLLDRPIEDGGPTMAAAGEVVVERIQDELEKARDAGATNDQVTELGRYVNLLATDLKLVGAARKSETLATRCQAAQDKIKSAMQRVEALEEDQAASA